MVILAVKSLILGKYQNLRGFLNKDFVFHVKMVKFKILI